MTHTLTLDAEALARHALRRGRDAKGLQPVGFRLDSEGINLAVTLPGPDYLAALLSLPGVDAYRDGLRLLTRPHGSEEPPAALDLAALADGLRGTLRALPERPGASEAYGDLRLAAGTSSPRLSAYLLDVVRAYVKTVPALPKRPEAPRQRGPVKTPEERLRAHRERKRAETRASARWALALYLDDDEAPALGSRIPGTVVYEYAVEVLAYAVERFEETVLDPDPRDETYGMPREERLAVWREIATDEWECPAPERPRPVSRRVLFEVAEALGAFRVIRRPKRSVALTIIRRFVARLQEATVNVLTRATEILGHGPRTGEEAEQYADTAVRVVLDLAPATKPDVYDPRVLTLPASVAYAVAGVPDKEVKRTFGLMAREHLRRHPEDRPALASVAAALKAGDPDGLVSQIRARCAAAIEAEEVSA